MFCRMTSYTGRKNVFRSGLSNTQQPQLLNPCEKTVYSAFHNISIFLGGVKMLV